MRTARTLLFAGCGLILLCGCKGDTGLGNSEDPKASGPILNLHKRRGDLQDLNYHAAHSKLYMLKPQTSATVTRDDGTIMFRETTRLLESRSDGYIVSLIQVREEEGHMVTNAIAILFPFHQVTRTQALGWTIEGEYE